jgi:hypothetical protein
MEKLDNLLIYSISSYLSLKDLYHLLLCNKNYAFIRECIYYHCVNNNINIPIDNYLIKSAFPLITENDEVKILYECLKDMKNVAICGGYMTSMYFLSSFFEDSDIDVYIWGSNKEVNENYCKLLTNLQRVFRNANKSRTGQSVITLTFPFAPSLRKIQVIFVDAASLTEILMDFDTMHNRCAYMNGDTYVTYDAQWSKKTSCTYFYKDIKKSRLEKARRYNLQILNKIKENELITGEIRVSRYERHFLEPIKPTRYWMSSYLTNKRPWLEKIKNIEKWHVRDIASLKLNMDYYGDIIFYKDDKEQINTFIQERKEYFLFYEVKGYLYRSEYNIEGARRRENKYYLYVNDKEQRDFVDDFCLHINDHLKKLKVYGNEHMAVTETIDTIVHEVNSDRIKIENNCDNIMHSQHNTNYKLALKIECSRSLSPRGFMLYKILHFII